MGELLKTFNVKILEWRSETASNELDTKITSGFDEEENNKYTKDKAAGKSATACDTTGKVIANYNDILVLLQAVAVKSSRVVAPPLLLCEDKRMLDQLRRLLDYHLTPLSTPLTAVPKYHSGLTGVLSNFAIRLKNTEFLRPIGTEKREAERETWEWDFLTLMAQHVILATSAAEGLAIPLAPLPSIHQFLNARNAMALQAHCTLTYVRHNLYLPTSFCQYLLQGHILTINDPDAHTVISPLLTTRSSSVPENSQQHVMRVQAFLTMGQDRMSKEEPRYLLDQWVHVVNTAQDLRNSTRKCVGVEGGYLGDDVTLRQAMST